MEDKLSPQLGDVVTGHDRKDAPPSGPDKAIARQPNRVGRPPDKHHTVATVEDSQQPPP